MAFCKFAGRSLRILAGQSAATRQLKVIACPRLQLRHASSDAHPHLTAEHPTAIVTGAARGIGRAVALRLARDGYDVCINDVDALAADAHEVSSMVEDMGRKSTVAIADVSKRSEVDSMVEHSVSTLGSLNTMVANAGIAQVKAALDLTEEDIQQMFSVNVFGVHNCYVAAAKQFIKQGPPPDHPPTQQGLAGVPIPSSGVYKIIGAASIVGFKPFPLLAHYSASKWAVRGLTQCMAMELAEHGITVNAYAPGIVGTKMWELIDEGLVKLKGGEKGQYLKKYSEEFIALGRTSVPEDVANTVHFLASPESDYTTGVTLLVDGGIIFA